MSWESEKRWSDKFIPIIKPILGTNFIVESSIEEDRDHNTDLHILNMGAIRFGCRIRRYTWYANYKNEFTIRAILPSGQKTELEKILEGWGDYIFYGFANENDTDLIYWFIGDLKVFRLWFLRQLSSNSKKRERKNNSDNSSKFFAFNKNELPKDFIFAESEIILS